MAKVKKTRKTDVPVVLRQKDLEDISNLYNAFTVLRGGIVDGQEFTQNMWVWITDDQKYPVFSERNSGIIGWFRWDIEVSDDLMFYPNRYVEVFVDADET